MIFPPERRAGFFAASGDRLPMRASGDRCGGDSFDAEWCPPAGLVGDVLLLLLGVLPPRKAGSRIFIML